MERNKPKCESCNFSSAAIKRTTRNGRTYDTSGYLCCHNSEKVVANKLFTGKTSPRWCPLITDTEPATATDKSDFVEYSLQPFITRLDDSVRSLSYLLDEETKEEYCIIRYKNGYERKVCITADSERAITSDVLKML